MSALIASSIRIRNAERGGRHKTILRESLRLAGLIARGGLDEELALRSLLDDAVAIGKEASEVIRIFEWSEKLWRASKVNKTEPASPERSARNVASEPQEI